MLETFEPDLPVRTERLLLRRLTEADVPALLGWRGDPEVCRYLPFEPMTEADLREKVAGRWAETVLGGDAPAIRLGIEADGVLVGDLTLFIHDRGNETAEVGWVLSPEHRGRGYAVEAARALLEVAFDGLRARRVVARMDPQNHASAAVAAAIGMRREALLVEDERFKGEWADTLLYALLAREHAAATA